MSAGWRERKREHQVKPRRRESRLRQRVHQANRQARGGTRRKKHVARQLKEKTTKCSVKGYT